jgi:hypothetical protein
MERRIFWGKLLICEKIMPAKVYQYGSPSNLIASGDAENQIQLQVRFWNRLVETDREFAERYREITYKADEKISSLNEQVQLKQQAIDALREEIKGRRSRAGSSKIDDSDAREKIAALLKEKKPLAEELKAYRAKILVMVKPRLLELEDERRARVKELRQEYASEGLYWGNYNAVLNNYQTARSRAMQSGRELLFHRYDGTGRWTCQIRGGMTVEEAFSEANNLFQIDPVPESAWTNPAKGERKRLCRTRARMRITSDEESNPVWLEIPIVMHRPIPPDARIKLVSINTRKLGDRVRWFLNVTVIEEDQQNKNSVTGDVLAVDIGWRKKPDGSIRVAYWVDSNGAAGEVNLDSSFVATHRRMSALQKNRDDNFNLAKEKLIQWLSNEAGEQERIPDWLSLCASTLAKWKAQARLAAVVLRWRDNRFTGGGEILEFLENWRRQDKHLWIWQANLRHKIGGRRLEQYRIFAAKAAREYDAVIFEEFDLRGARRKKPPEQGVDARSGLRNLAKIAGVSLLRSEMKRAFDAAGKLFVKVPMSWMRACPFCGAATESDQKAGILLTCGNCGKVYDRNWAKAKDLLSRWFLARKMQ